MSIDDAIRHHEAGRLREAERLYKSVLDAEPNHPDALHLLGVLLTQVGEYDDAVEHIQAALNLDRDSAPFRSSLAQAYFRSGKLTEAIATLERALALQPDSFQAFSDLGAVLQESGELERAITAYRRSIALHPGLAIVHFNLGTALKQRGSISDAIACVEKAVAMDATQANFSAALAGYYLEADEPDAALQSCHACLSLAPRNLMALTFKSIALDRLGDRESAARIVDFDRLIQRRRLAVPAGYGSTAEFNDALAKHVRNHPTLKSEPVNNATRYGMHTDNLLVNASGPVPALAELIDEAVTDYLQSLPMDPTHPYLAYRPSGFKFMMWSVVMDSQGHQLPHMHPDGWVSGVYYVELPGEMHAATGEQAGWIEFGRPLRALTGSWEPVVKTLRPEEGMLVLFPSYFYHQTIPFESPEQRICIAFDAVPRFRK
ncbi:MAG: tetratricopeptide repeat protein [Lysobacterales bacterium]|nr:MAG: tetratricopeptide repeat protein [Xanthomonadales bacterium]